MSIAPHISHYLELNLALVHIPPNSKAPQGNGWQRHPVTTEDEAARLWRHGGNVGVVHQHSGTLALDVDDYEGAKRALARVGIDLDALLGAEGPKIKGSRGLKPLYRLPEGVTLKRVSLAWPTAETRGLPKAQQKLETIFELRAGATQDVLPGSIHPDGTAYEWVDEPRTRDDIPVVPGGLLTLAQNWPELKPLLLEAAPGYVPPQPKPHTSNNSTSGGVIGPYNKRTDLRELLEGYGYKPKGWDRFTAPSSSTGVPGVTVFESDDGLERAYSHHGSDPLNDGHSHDAFSVRCVVDFDGDVKAAVKAVAFELGLAQTKGGAKAAAPRNDDPTEQPNGKTRKPVEEKEARRSQATELGDLIGESGAELFHNPDDEPFITFPVGGHRETHRLKSKAARAWLRRLYREKTGKSIGGQALQDCLNDLEGAALFDGEAHPVYVRVAPHGEDIILDLGDESHRVVRITASGWHLEAHSPVKFVRPKALAALPTPVPGGTLAPLWEAMNVAKQDRVLLAATLAAALRPHGPYPALNFTGEQGSAKSTAARIARALVDPSTAPLRSAPKDPRDLMIAATSSWWLTFDNLSGFHPDLSDALCALLTGGGYATRTLYADSEETILSAQRPVIMTGIADIITRPDLLDRTIILYLPRITDKQRRPESAFWEDFRKVHGSLVGALLTAVSAGLAKLPSVHLDELP